MKYLIIFFMAIGSISCANNKEHEANSNDRDISDSYVMEVTKNKLHKETAVLVCYNDNYRKCHSDTSVESCIQSLKIHEPLVRKSAEMRYPDIHDRNTFAEYAVEYTKRTVLVRAFIEGRRDLIVPCLNSNPVLLSDSEANLKADNPENVRRYLGL